MAKKKATELAITKRSRSSVVLKTTLKIGARKTKNKIIRRINPAEAESPEQEERAIAEILFKGLCQLRGTAIKIAQAISGETGILKPEHMATLQQSQYRVPPLNPVVVAKVFRTDFQKDPNDLFLEFENHAFAAASLGQVHRAQLHDGTAVAVKVQHPGIDQTISIDLGVARKFLGAVPRNGVILNSLSHIESRLYEEVDYQIELANAQKFYQILSSSDIVIPKVYPNHSSKRIITYEYLRGQHLLEWLKLNPSKAQCSKIGQMIWNLFFDSLRKHRILHCDPNWGNYLIIDSKHLALLDFGCVQKLTPDSVELFECLWRPSSWENNDRILAIYRSLGAEPELMDSTSDEVFYQRMIRPYQDWLAEIANLPLFDFELAKGIGQRGQKLLFREVFESSMQNFSSEFTLVHRTFFGVIQILEALGAEISTQPET